MDLKRRLDALRREAGSRNTAGAAVPAGDPPVVAVDAPLDGPEMEAAPVEPAALRNRLERLAGRAARGPGRGGGMAASAEALAERFGGTVVAEHLVLVETALPLHRRHGRLPLADALEPLWPLATPSPAPPPQAGQWLRCHSLPPEEGFCPPLPLAGEGPGVRENALHPAPGLRLLGIDTETTGLAGGTGTAAFMVGVAEAGPEGIRLRQWLLTAFAGEAAMLAELERNLSTADLLVSYNGKTFDLPLLRDRRRLQRAPALPEPRHLDLLHPTRRLFRAAWPDCRLATAERHLLGLVREHDLPGSEAPRAWRDYLAGAPPDDLARVLHHNALDVLSLLLLGPVLSRALREPQAFGADPLAAADVWARNGDEAAALAVLERSSGRLDTRGELEFARALRRVGRWAEAARIWERLAREGNAEAVERLAKYHEHVRHDWSRALDYAARLDDGPEVRHRRERLRRRLGGRQGSLDFS